MKRFASCLFILFLLSPVRLLALDNNVVHPALTNAAVDHLIATEPDLAYLTDYAHFDIKTSPQLVNLDEGSVKEDYALSPNWDTDLWGWEQDSAVPGFSWKSHGYNPRTGEVWYGIPDVAPSALDYAADIWAEARTASNRYFQLGRFIHLMEDMASPSHAHADIHATGDDFEIYGGAWFATVPFSLAAVRTPATDGLTAQAGLPHPDMQADTPQNFIRNVAWRTYYMSSYQGGVLTEQEGDSQPDSELKRMFPYENGGLRYDDGGWFVNDSYVIDDVGNNWIGWGIGVNPDWWECPEDPGYFYLENVDGDPDGTGPSVAGNGIVPAVFKAEPFRRIHPTDDLDAMLEANSRILTRVYGRALFPMVAEWVAGFLSFAERE